MNKTLSMIGISCLSALFLFGCAGGTASTTPSATTAAKPATSSQTATVVVKSADGSVSLSVPSGWNTNDTSLFPGAVIGVADTTNTEFVIVTKRAKTDIGANSAISDYMTTVKNVFSAILTAPAWGQTSSVKIGNCSGLSAQVSGVRKRDNANLVFFIDAVASKNFYYNVCGWTTSDQADARKANIQGIFNSFKETD